jgi:hypothetical protein
MEYFNKPLVVAVIAENTSDADILRQLQNVERKIQDVIIFRPRDANAKWAVSDAERHPNIGYVTFQDQDHVEDPQNSTVHFTQLHTVDFKQQHLVVCRSVARLHTMQRFLDGIGTRPVTHTITDNFVFMSEFPFNDIDVENLMLERDGNNWTAMVTAINSAYDD